MQATIEKVSNLERRLNVSVPLQEIEAEVENRLKRLARSVRMHGFRPGKVPFRLVEQTYGGQVRQEVLGDVLQKSFGEAVRQQNLRVAGFPRFEPRPASEGSQQVEFSATFEVYPEVTVNDLSGLQIERPVVSVGEAEVDKTVEILRKQRMYFREIDREARTGDSVTIDYRGTIDGEEFQGGSGTDQGVVLGQAGLLADFERQVLGMRTGESRVFELTFPEDYHGKEVAGKTARFDVIVKRVAEPVLPEVDADFAKALGIADGDIRRMREDVKANLERELRRRKDARVKDQVMKGLLENSSIELPKALVQMEIERMMEGMRRDLQARGLKGEQMALPAGTFEPEAERRVALGLIIAELVKREKLAARPEQIKAVVQDHAQSYENPEEVVRWYYQSPDRLREVESLVLESNVVEWVLSKARVQDRPMDFDDLMGKRD
jgi:trigger factor